MASEGPGEEAVGAAAEPGGQKPADPPGEPAAAQRQHGNVEFHAGCLADAISYSLLFHVSH